MIWVVAIGFLVVFISLRRIENVLVQIAKNQVHQTKRLEK